MDNILLCIWNRKKINTDFWNRKWKKLISIFEIKNEIAKNKYRYLKPNNKIKKKLISIIKIEIKIEIFYFDFKPWFDCDMISM
jgi:hypothetical protein